MGGIQLDVQAFLEDESESHAPGDAETVTESEGSSPDPHHRKHA
jgi:hypothetical protein